MHEGILVEEPKPELVPADGPQEATAEAPVEAPAKGPELYPLDDPMVEAEIEAEGLAIGVRFRRPTNEELIQRQEKIIHEEIPQPSTEDGEAIVKIKENFTQAHIYIFDQCCTFVNGYDLADGQDPAEWRLMDDHLRGLIPSAHKIAAASALHRGSCLRLRDKTQTAFRLVGAPEEKVLQLQGQFRITHCLRRPTEAEWVKYTDNSLQQLEKTADGQTYTVYRANLQASIDLYDAIVIRIEGATVGGQPWSKELRPQFISLVDGLVKQAVIAMFAADWKASLRD